jgi:hypothetical protein
VHQDLLHKQDLFDKVEPSADVLTLTGLCLPALNMIRDHTVMSPMEEAHSLEEVELLTGADLLFQERKVVAVGVVNDPKEKARRMQARAKAKAKGKAKVRPRKVLPVPTHCLLAVERRDWRLLQAKRVTRVARLTTLIRSPRQ